MTQTANNAEGGTNGTTVTAANSGGASGDAWNTVSITAGSCIYSNTIAAHGVLSYKITTTSASTGRVYLQRNLATTTSAAYATRFYLYIPTGTKPDPTTIFGAINTGVGYNLKLQLSSTNNINVIDASNLPETVSSTSLSTLTLYRIELTVNNATGPTSGNLILKIFLGDSTTPLETITLNGRNWGSSDTGFMWYGISETLSNTVTNGLYFDDIAENNTGVFIGTPITNISLSRTFKWNVRSPLSLSRIFVWNVKSALSLTRVFIWNVRAVLSLNRVFKWNVRTAVTPFARIFKWNVIAGVLISRIFIWNTRQTITPVRIFKWNVRIPVTPFTRTFIWNTRLQVSLARSFIWNIIFKLITPRIFVWNVRLILNISRTFLWNDVGRIVIVRSLVWDVYAPWVANVKDCGPWTSINGNTVAWTPEQVNSTSWR